MWQINKLLQCSIFPLILMPYCWWWIKKEHDIAIKMTPTASTSKKVTNVHVFVSWFTYAVINFITYLATLCDVIWVMKIFCTFNASREGFRNRNLKSWSWSLLANKVRLTYMYLWRLYSLHLKTFISLFQDSLIFCSYCYYLSPKLYTNIHTTSNFNFAYFLYTFVSFTSK